MKRIFTFVLLLLLLTSCRYDSYTPSSPISEYEIDHDINFFYKPEKADIYELGDDILIEYRVFSTSDVVDIQIIKKSTVIYTLAEDEKNDGMFIWKTDNDIMPSNHYQVKIVNPSNEDVFIISERFGLISK